MTKSGEKKDSTANLRLINYKEIWVAVSCQDVKFAWKKLAHAKDSEKKKIMFINNEQLAMDFPSVLANRASATMFNRFCQAVTIWFANEITEWRGNLETDDETMFMPLCWPVPVNAIAMRSFKPWNVQ